MPSPSLHAALRPLTQPAAPFFRQVGGKRQLVSRLLEHVPDDFRERYTTYVEPFLGGGAMYFALHNAGLLAHKVVVLGDADEDIGYLFRAVRDVPQALYLEVQGLIHEAQHASDPEAVYRRERKRWNASERTPPRHLFLRHGAFNGLWRTNRRGEMNAPWKGKPPRSVKAEEIEAAHRALNDPRVEIVDWDFRDYADTMDDASLIYLDPPYLDEKKSAFRTYRPEGWSFADFLDLIQLAARWSKEGAHVILSHADTEMARTTIAQVWPSAVVRRVQARRAVNSDGTGRGPVPELIVTSALAPRSGHS